MTLPKTILVVDDDPDVQSLLQDFLTDAHYNVVVGRNGYGALIGLRDVKPDLILLDLKMPTMDGIAFLNKLSEIVAAQGGKGRPRVIVMTGFADKGKVLKAKELNVDDIIAKPFQLDDLAKRIEQCLEAQTVANDDKAA